MDKTIELVKEIAREAGAILMRYRVEGFSVATKKDKFDFVTEADTESNAFLLKKLRTAFPHDAILTEEGVDNPKDFSGTVWMVDPLDGTKHYVAGGDGFSVMIGLAINGIPQMGVVYAPVSNTFYWAKKGQGAWMQVGDTPPIQLRVSVVDRLGKATLVMRYRHNESRPTDSFEDGLRVKARVQEASVGLKIGRIAQGKADAVFNLNTHAHKWDYCAPEIIIKEAGGKLTDLHGNDLNYLLPEEKFSKMTVGSNGVLHEELLECAKAIETIQ